MYRSERFIDIILSENLDNSVQRIINKSAHAMVVYTLLLRSAYTNQREQLFVTLLGSPEPSESDIQFAYAFCVYLFNFNFFSFMKKTVLLLSSILVSVPTFAYGYGSDLDDSLTWIGILFFVWGVLEIILFFKIWGATDNIEKMKSAICDGMKVGDIKLYLRKMYVLGKEDEAYDYLNQSFSNEIVKLHDKCTFGIDPEGYVGTGQNRRSVVDDFNAKKKYIISEYQIHYQSIGKEMPQRFYDIELNDLTKIR